MRLSAAPELIETERLLLRRPTIDDAETAFHCYAGDREVTRYLGWQQHRSVEDTRKFFELSDQVWEQHHVGPYLISDRSNQTLLGSTGLDFETEQCASTGYVLAKKVWGNGIASEALRAMVDLASSIGFQRVYALCHPEHIASIRVLEKCGFQCEERLRAHTKFPNLIPDKTSDVLCYVSKKKGVPVSRHPIQGS